MLAAGCAMGQTVEGSVVNSATGAGIAGIAVELVQDGMRAYSATTGSDGSFRVEGVKDGVYSVRCPSRHYWPAPGAEEQPFQVIAGRDAVKLKASLMPLCRIGGRVVDAQGRPAAHAQVEITDPSPTMAESDDQGRFVFEDLPPGFYTLSVRPADGWKAPEPEAGSDQTLGWARTWYPGVARADAMTPVVMAPGSALADVELRLMAAPAHAIRGVLRNPDGTPAGKLTITLADEVERVPPPYHTESKGDGTFEFPAVVDGEWRLAAEEAQGGVSLRAIEWMEMAGQDLGEVSLRLSPPLGVRGRVMVEAPKDAPAPKAPAVRLDAHIGRIRRDAFPVFWAMPAASLLGSRPDADGVFHIENVYPGAYRIAPGEAPRGYYLDSVRVGDTETSAAETEFAGAASITVVFKANGGTVRGTVENCASGQVLLIPQDPAMRRPGFFRETKCDDHDRYEMAAVRPGEYYALALAGVGAAPFGLLAPEAASLRFAYAHAYTGRVEDGFATQAAHVTVRAGEATLVDMRAITRLVY